MIVWTWIKRIVVLLLKTIRFILLETCCFMTGYLVVLIFALFLSIKKQTFMPMQLALIICGIIAIAHRIFVISTFFLQRNYYNKRKNEQVEKRKKYIQLVKECIAIV